jgi:hypothetical protein
MAVFKKVLLFKHVLQALPFLTAGSSNTCFRLFPSLPLALQTRASGSSLPYRCALLIITAINLNIS